MSGPVGRLTRFPVIFLLTAPAGPSRPQHPSPTGGTCIKLIQLNEGNIGDGERATHDGRRACCAVSVDGWELTPKPTAPVGGRRVIYRPRDPSAASIYSNDPHRPPGGGRHLVSCYGRVAYIPHISSSADQLRPRRRHYRPT